MKKLLSIMLCIVMLTGLMPVNAALGAKVVSGFDSFEAKRSGVFSASMRKAEYSEDVANTGKVSVKLPGDPDHQWSILSFSTELKANKKYTLSFYAYAADGNCYVQPTVTYYANGSSKTITFKSDLRAVPCGQFGRVLCNFEIKADPGVNVTDTGITINVHGYSDTYIDDLEIIEGYLDIPVMKTKDLPFNEIVPKDDNYIDLFVSNEAAPGGDGSLEKPFSSLVEARDYVRTINKDMKSNIRVNVRGGYYFLEDAFVLTDEDSGTNGYHVIYQPYNNEEVILSGGERVTGWTESEIPGVYKTSLHAPTLRNLYVNDVRATRARLEEYVTPISWWDDESDSLSKKDGFVLPKGIIKNPEKATNLEIFKSITFRSYWAVKGRAQDNGDTTILKMRQPEFYDHEQTNYIILTWKDTDNFRLENALEFLDKPGEWFQDIDTDTLYYMPLEGENIYESEVVAPRTEEILKVQGSSLDNRAENIVVRGFTFAHGANDWTSEKGRCIVQSTAAYTFDKTYHYSTGWRIQPGNLKIANARNVAFRDNVVKHMDSVGLSMPFGVENCEIDGNRIYDISSSALNIGEADHVLPIDIGILPTNTRISNNILADTAVEYGACPAIACYYADGFYVENNDIYDMGYSGLSLGWGWSTKETYAREYIVKNNRLWGANQVCTDGAAIYTLGNIPGSVIEGNYLGIKPARVAANLIYHDSGSCNFYSKENVIDGGNLPLENWIATYQPDYKNIVMDNNYTSNMKRSYQTKTAVETETHFEPDGSWSKGARDIIARAGLSDEYKGMREFMPDWEEHKTIKKVTLQTKEYDSANPVPLKSGESATLTALYEQICGDLHYGDSFARITSTDESVVRIEGNKIVAAGPGLAVVSATTSDGYSASLSVTVDDKAEKLNLIVTTDEVAANDVMYLKYALKTKYWRYVDLPHEYTSSRPHIATIDDMGVVRGKTNGKTKLTLKVTFEGEVLTETWDIQVKDASAASTIKVDKHIYEVSEDSDFLASLVKGNKTTKLSSANTSAAYTSLVNKSSGAIPDTYSTDMKFLLSQGLIDTGVNPADYVTDEQLTSYIEKMTGKKREDFSVIAENVPLTRERAAYILSNALVYIWGNNLIGQPRLADVSDRDEISPEYVPYVANAVWCEMFDINAVQTEFEPKKLMTYDDVGVVLNRLKNPKNIRNFVYEDFWFNRAYEGEGTSREAHSLKRSDSYKTITKTTTENVDVSGGLLIPKEPGNYSVSLVSKQGAVIVKKDDYCYVYDKNDIITDGEYKAATYGDDGMYGYVLKEDDKIRMISYTGDVWDKKDTYTYAYKTVSDTDFEMTLTIDSLANSDADAGAGIMIRKSDAPNDIKIDYRIKPGGNTFLCFRTYMDGPTNFSQGKNLSFPVTLKLVKEGDQFSAYYLDGDKWVLNMSTPLAGMDGSYIAGPYMSSLSTRSKRPGSAIFSNIYMGKIRAMDNAADTEEVKSEPEKEPEPIDPNFKLDRRYYYDTLPDGTFEKTIYGWNAGEGKAASSGEAYRGKSSLALTPNSGSVYVAYSMDTISLDGNKKHYIAFRAKTDTGTATMTPYIQYFKDGKAVRSKVTYKTERKIDSEDWKEIIVETEFEAVPAGAMLVIHSSGSSRVFIDNVELLYERDNVTEEDLEAPVEEPEEEEFNLDRRRYLNKLTNGSFERGVTGWNVVGGSVKGSSYQKFSGNKSLQLVPDSSEPYITHSVEGGFKADKKYYLVFRAKTKEGNATFSPYIQYHNGKKYVRCEVNCITDMTANADEWKEFIAEMTFPVNPTSELLLLYVETKSDVYIDSVELLYN